MRRLTPLLAGLLLLLAPEVAAQEEPRQSINLIHPTLKGLDGVSVQLAVGVFPTVGWYRVARGDPAKISMQVYREWQGAAIEAIKTEIARSKLALETQESQLHRMQKNDYSSPKVSPYVEVHKGWYRARLKLRQSVELPNGQHAEDPVTYETEPSTGKLGENPKRTIVRAVRNEVDEFLRDWRNKNN